MSDQREETFIIDGYNLLRRAFRFLDEEHGLEAARMKLEVRLREFLRAKAPGVHIVLVYDGAARVEPSLAPRNEPGLEIIFSTPPQNADQAIIAECRRRGGQHRGGEGPITVVTSDLKDIAFPLRGEKPRHRTSEEFAEILDQALRRPSSRPPGGLPPAIPAPEKPEVVTPEEVEEWMRIFSQPRRDRPKPSHGDRE